ncbi:hypothetical protein [Pedobacter westerhofensis]|nr:hypothetical protein [Pedobacter westerhofensis]
MMESIAVKSRKVNGSITRKVIELHNIGYVFDFLMLDQQELICLQDNKHFQKENVNVKVMGQGYDLFSHSFKYIHTIETSCGKRGLLLAEKVYTWLT